ncbi:MAG: hypothetical protein RRY79_03350 [Clostridia bacterium]
METFGAKKIIFPLLRPNQRYNPRPMNGTQRTTGKFSAEMQA